MRKYKSCASYLAQYKHQGCLCVQPKYEAQVQLVFSLEHAGDANKTILCMLQGTTRDGDPGKDEDEGFGTSLKLKNVTYVRVSQIRTKLFSFVTSRERGFGLGAQKSLVPVGFGLGTNENISPSSNG